MVSKRFNARESITKFILDCIDIKEITKQTTNGCKNYPCDQLKRYLNRNSDHLNFKYFPEAKFFYETVCKRNPSYCTLNKDINN